MNNKRAIYMLVVFGLLFLTLIGYLTYLEVFYAKDYKKSAYNPRNYELEKNILRGSIYDRNSTLLAYSERVKEEKTETVNGTEQKYLEERYVRRYPFNNLYSHVIGYVSGDYSNRTLIENEYNESLIEEGVFSKISGEEKKGKDIYITIDHELQKEANAAIGSYRGSIVALNPKSGEILAMVSKPDFNPNYDVLNFDTLEDTALFSRAIQMTYPPGSTYKIISAAAAINNGLENEIYEDKTGQYVIKSSDGNDKNDFVCQNVNKKPYLTTSLQSAFEVSSNVYFCHIGASLSTDEIQESASEFLIGENLNKSLGFDLPIKSSSFQKGKMTPAERAISSIGQGKTEMTPLHLALVGASIANGGIMPRPYLVSKVGISNKLPSVNEGVRVIGEDVALKIKDMMLNVVESGTGSAAKISGVKVCGKTGSSENTLTGQGGSNTNKTHALFVGFAPYDDPKIAVCVLLEHAGYGGTYAAPIARRIMQKYLSGIN